MFDLVRRHGLLALTLLACLTLIVAEFTNLCSIRTAGVGVVLETTKGGGHHGYALLIIGLAAAAMALGANLGRSRPAALAVVVLGGVALAIVLLVDVPVLDDTGHFGKTYEAEAQAEVGFKIETAGAILLLFAGVCTVLARSFARAPEVTERDEPRRSPAPAPGP